MATDLELRIVVGATDAASNVVSNIAGNIIGKMDGINPALGMVAGGMMAIVGGSIAVGIASTHMAADFQQAMLSNVAHAGLAKDQFDKVSQAVLGMASAVGRSPTQLAEALYPILSAFSGIQNQSAKSAIALDTLKMSFQTVAGTTVDGTAVANAAVGTFNALGLATDNVSTNTKRMTGLFDVMDKTVQLGNMQWDAYKNVVSKLAVAIQGTGISFNESQAALATMTNEGFSAQRASTYLSNTFTTLAIKTDALAKHAKALHISFDESKYSSMSLADKIAYLNEVTDGNKQKLLALMGNNSTALKTFNALSVGISGYKSNLDALNHSHGALASSFETANKGFNFQMQQIKAGLDAVLITIGTQLLPVFSKLAAQLLPLIQQFGQWLVKSGALQVIASALANGITFLVNALVQMVTIGVQVVNFFQQNQWAGDALIAILAGVAAGMIFMALTALPPLIASLLMWGGVAIAVGIANVIAFWPILAVIAAVAIAVFLVILVVRNWGAIAHWLVGAWHAAISWLTGALHSIGQFFVSVWAWIKSATMAAWNFLVDIVRQGAHFLYLVIFGPFLAIGALFSWLYNHNYYFKALIDTIVNVVKAGVAWLVGAWHTAISWIVDQWNYLKTMAEVYFLLIYVMIEEKILLAESFLHSVWNRVVGFLAGIWQTISNAVSQAWQFISRIFSSAWSNYVSSPLNSLWNSILGFVNGWPAQAVQWGKNLIQGLINGILGMIGNVGNAVGKIAGKIGSFLGFHSPAKEGEGAHLMEWPRNMVKSYADELAAQTPYLQAKVNMLVAPLAIMSHAIPLTGHSNTPLTSAPANGAGNQINIYVNAPARTQDEATEIADCVAQRLGFVFQGQSTMIGGIH